jgi:transposase, IS30 family
MNASINKVFCQGKKRGPEFKSGCDEELQGYVVRQLREGLSPEEIAGRLKSEPPEELSGKYINHESIYQYIYDGEGKWQNLYPCLRRKQRKRKPKRGRKSQKIKTD